MAEKPILSANEVVKTARGWLGTRFHHQGRKKAAAGYAGGCDCLGLLVGVAEELHLRGRDGAGRLAAYDERDYGHLPDGKRLQAVLDAVLLRQPEGVKPAPADVLLLRLTHAPQHLAIVTDYSSAEVGIIHALAVNRRVVEHRLDELWRRRIVAVYRIPHVEST